MSYATSLPVVIALTIFGVVASSKSHVHMESMLPRSSVQRLQSSPKDALHEVVIAIHQNNVDKLEEMVLDRSTPGSPNFQKWMTFEEVGTLISNEPAVAAVTDWLNLNDIEVNWMSKRGEYIKVEAPIAIWEELFQTTFFEWEDLHSDRNARTFHLAERYSIPSLLANYVDAVFNTVQTPPIIRKDPHLVTPDSVEVRPSAQGLRSNNMNVQGSSGVTVSYLNSMYRIESNIGEGLQCQTNCLI
jgi:subtilase family serine protease